MSASIVSRLTPVSRNSWRSHGLRNQAYDPQQSFAYTSAYSGVAASMLECESTSCSYGAPEDGVLTKELLQSGLRDLGRVADGTKQAYLTLYLSGQGLEDVTILSSYGHLQRLNLASNNLSDVSILSNLPYLVYLDVSYNKLTTVLNFQPPNNLLEVNYSHNEIEEICDLSAHPSLTKLALDSNQITEISGLSQLHQLTHLSLADNRLEHVSNLDNLPLKILNLSGNAITAIEKLETLTQLQILDLSGNQISSLHGLDGHPCLMELSLEENEVVSIDQVKHLKGLHLLKSLNLIRNPVEALGDYRQTVLFELPSLILLDNQRCEIQEKVTSMNTFSPPPELVAARDHRTNTIGAVRKAARLRFSTLTRVDEPYPMLVLCGPPGAGKAYFTRLLVDEFPSFFGLGVSHTTRVQRAKESHGRDYYFIDKSTFQRAAKSGEFVQTFTRGTHYYGITMAAIEQVAQQGLACVTHMSLEGVMTMKNTHFEPRYILALPLTSQIHEQRLKAKGNYSDAEVKRSLEEVDKYRKIHQDNPGFFDTAINTDSLRDGYRQLRSLVMAYGDITPESPFSLTSASNQTTQQTSTSVTSSERTTPQPLTGTHTPSLLDDYEDTSQTTGQTTGYTTGCTTPQHEAASTAANYEAVKHIQGAAKAWSRPPSSGSRPASEGQQFRQGAATPLSDFGGRKHKQIRAAVAGKEFASYEDSITSTSRPGTSMSKSSAVVASKVAGRQEGKTLLHSPLEEQDFSGEDSDSESSEQRSPSVSSLSKLSSERGFSPTHPDSAHSLH